MPDRYGTARICGQPDSYRPTLNKGEIGKNLRKKRAVAGMLRECIALLRVCIAEKPQFVCLCPTNTNVIGFDIVSDKTLIPKSLLLCMGNRS